jgi:large subunit ribosomal protein L25
MEVGKLTVQVRNSHGKGASRRLRSDKLVPGICYGSGLDQPLSITVSPKALKASLDPAKGRNSVIDVTVEDAGQTRNLTAMLWEYQVHPLRREVTHVDLIAIDPAKELEVQVPIELTGKPAGAIDGGQVHVERHSIPVRCLPAAIPASIVLDVSPLRIGDGFHVADLAMPAGVVAAVGGEFSICTCVAPKAEKETGESTVAAAAEAPAGDKKGDAKKADAKAGGDDKKK